MPSLYGGGSTGLPKNFGHTQLQTLFPDDPPFDSITRDQLVSFFAWLHDGYVSESPGHIPRPSVKLSPKTIRNVHTFLSALWSWAVEVGLVEKNIVRTIEPPVINDPVIEAFTPEQIAAMLKACDYCAEAHQRASPVDNWKL